MLGHLPGLFLFPVEIPVLLPDPMASSRRMNGMVEGLSSRSGGRRRSPPWQQDAMVECYRGAGWDYGVRGRVQGELNAKV